MNGKMFGLVTLVLGMLFIGRVDIAHGYPWFARRLVDSCNKCHTAFPQNNDYGQYVKYSSYELPQMSYDGLDESIIRRFLDSKSGKIFLEIH